MSLAFVTGNISAGSMTRFARRLELQAETIALNRTQVAFSHGEDVFGWRFQPRFQTRPTQGNLTAFGQTLFGGPTREGDRRQLELEPGMRECVALVIIPSFVPYVTFETRANWYRLNSPKHAVIDTLKYLDLSKSVQRARVLSQAICDAGVYRPGDVARLVARVNQLAAELPMQTMIAQVPYENTHGGFELFNVGVTDLGPELRSWYGAPGVSVSNGTSLFLVGDSFSVHQTSVIVGNKLISGGDLTLLSRQVMRVNVPPGTQAVTRGGQPFVEISIATPYGVSQPLYVPVVDLAPQAAAPAPASAFSLSPDTQTLGLLYQTQLDPQQPKLSIGAAQVAPPNQTIDILWKSPTGIAPLHVQVDFDFEYNGSSFRISRVQPIRITGAGGIYRIEGDQLATIAQEYVELLDQVDDFSIEKKLPALPTKRITVRPIADGQVLDVQAVAVDGTLTIQPTLTARVAAPPAGTSQLPAAGRTADDAAPPAPAVEPGGELPPLPGPSTGVPTAPAIPPPMPATRAVPPPEPGARVVPAPATRPRMGGPAPTTPALGRVSSGRSPGAVTTSR